MDGEGPRIAINGFGRIGRLVTRLLLQGEPPVDLVAINDLTDTRQLAHLFRYDSVHGRYQGHVEATDDGLVLDGDRLLTFTKRDAADLPWGDLQPDLVIEASGKFRDAEGLQKHIDAGAPQVLLTAPGEAEAMIVRGVNDDAYTGQKTVSAASCTTNCLAPALKVLDDAFGVTSGLMTTVHAVTNDQRLLDGPHKDFRRARSAMASMIPTQTGAARAIGKVMPHLDGRIDGQAVRVPTSDVSLVDLTARLDASTHVGDVSNAFDAAARGSLHGILGFETEPLVSVDFVGDARSSIVDGPAIQVQDDLVKVLSWYDNEAGYANRVVELAHRMAS